MSGAARAWLRAAWEPASVAACISALRSLLRLESAAASLGWYGIIGFLAVWAGWRVGRLSVGSAWAAMLAGAAVPMAVVVLFGAIVLVYAVVATASDGTLVGPVGTAFVRVGGLVLASALMGAVGWWLSGKGRVTNAT